MDQSGRIVATGLSRTGTRSLYALFRQVGIDAVHYPFDAQTVADLRDGKPPALLSDHRALLDLPAVLSYKAIDDSYPGSVFVHTRRNKDQWLASVQEHYAGLLADWHTYPEQFQKAGEWMTCAVYGSFPVRPDLLAAAYDRHEAQLSDYFQDRDDFVVCDVVEGSPDESLLRVLEPFGVNTLPDRWPHIIDADEEPTSYAERTVLKGEHD